VDWERIGVLKKRILIGKLFSDEMSFLKESGLEILEDWGFKQNQRNYYFVVDAGLTNEIYQLEKETHKLTKIVGSPTEYYLRPSSSLNETDKGWGLFHNIWNNLDEITLQESNKLIYQYHEYLMETLNSGRNSDSAGKKFSFAGSKEDMSEFVDLDEKLKATVQKRTEELKRAEAEAMKKFEKENYGLDAHYSFKKEHWPGNVGD